MAKVVMGIGMSHSPLLALPGDRWGERGADDQKNPGLNLIDGRLVDYPAVVKELGEKWGHVANIETYRRLEDGAQRALDRLADDLDRVRPDVVVIVGDDHYELFSAANMPAIAIYHGKEALSHEQAPYPKDHWRTTVAQLYAMDEVHTFPVHDELAAELVAGLMARDFDIGSSAKVEDPRTMGFGHAFGFVVERIYRGKTIPMVPVMLNTYFPPNRPTARRCYRFGQSIGRAIAGWNGRRTCSPRSARCNDHEAVTIDGPAARSRARARICSAGTSHTVDAHAASRPTSPSRNRSTPEQYRSRNAVSCNPSATSVWAMPSSNARSVPGRIGNHCAPSESSTSPRTGETLTMRTPASRSSRRPPGATWR